LSNIIIIIIIIIIDIQPLGQFGQEPEPSQVTGMALVRRILGKFLRVVCHCFPPCQIYTFGNNLQEDVSTSPNPQAGGPSLVGCPRLLGSPTYVLFYVCP
jgi:hypothetical protein